MFPFLHIEKFNVRNYIFFCLTKNGLRRLIKINKIIIDGNFCIFMCNIVYWRSQCISRLSSIFFFSFDALTTLVYKCKPNSLGFSCCHCFSHFVSVQLKLLQHFIFWCSLKEKRSLSHLLVKLFNPTQPFSLHIRKMAEHSVAATQCLNSRRCLGFLLFFFAHNQSD